MRTPCRQPFSPAAIDAETGVWPADGKSFASNNLPIKSLFSRICEASQHTRSAKCCKCNNLRVIVEKISSDLCVTKSLSCNILRVNSLDSRICGVYAGSSSRNPNDSNILRRMIGKKFAGYGCPISGRFCQKWDFTLLSGTLALPSSQTNPAPRFARLNRRGARPPQSDVTFGARIPGTTLPFCDWSSEE